ncbi:hypothetical protein [Patulibacter defluvii]|uniref:hypothetical protein n=1 Tax=Patulibacter defluvii TaxID=3095358 RepID=UPI002A74C00D|nr:hypothetical protein [Patulibacter sp. DM4]
MSTNESFPGAGGPGGPGREPTQEELLAAYEEQIRNVRVEDVVVQSLASLIELGGRRAGLAPGALGERDPAQLEVAIEAIKALQPVAAPLLGPNAKQVEQALSQLQMAYAQLASGQPAAEDPTGPLGADVSPGGGAAPAEGAAPGTPPAPAAEPGKQEPSAVESGRLWIPGQ